MDRYELYYDTPGGEKPIAVVTGNNRAMATAIRTANAHDRVVWVLPEDGDIVDRRRFSVLPNDPYRRSADDYDREHLVELASAVMVRVIELTDQYRRAMDALRRAQDALRPVSIGEADAMLDCMVAISNDFTNAFGVIVGIEPNEPLADLTLWAD